MHRDLRAALIRECQEVREHADNLLALLLPETDSDECPHPADKVVDDSTMGEPLFRCTLCNAEQSTPFTTRQE